jgi:hypothetical protein
MGQTWYQIEVGRVLVSVGNHYKYYYYQAIG